MRGMRPSSWALLAAVLTGSSSSFMPLGALGPSLPRILSHTKCHPGTPFSTGTRRARGDVRTRQGTGTGVGTGMSAYMLTHPHARTRARARTPARARTHKHTPHARAPARAHARSPTRARTKYLAVRRILVADMTIPSLEVTLPLNPNPNPNP